MLAPFPYVGLETGATETVALILCLQAPILQRPVVVTPESKGLRCYYYIDKEEGNECCMQVRVL